MATPPLGWIIPSDRTQEQADAHAAAMAAMPMFSLPYTLPTGPVKVMLTDFWKDPNVVADVGLTFNGFHQLTGSCVGASAGNAIFTLSAVQRMISDNPTVAVLPWWPWAYGTTRHDEGDRGQGEGAVDSIMGQVLKGKGNLAATEPGLPTYTQSADGLVLTSKIEMTWSDGGRIDPKWAAAAEMHQVGTVAPLNSSADIKACILNGYPVLDGCSNYVGHGSIAGSGANAYVRGKYDGRGGHSTCFLGYQDHPNDGPLYLYSNQWPTITYPVDPAGAGRCCVWLPESEVDKLFRTGGDQGETMGMSHLEAGFVPQPKVLDWFVAP
jgi:hypothetical protein